MRVESMNTKHISDATIRKGEHEHQARPQWATSRHSCSKILQEIPLLSAYL